MRITVDGVGNVLVQLRDAQAVAERRGEVIVDVNQQGHWIRGFEVVGGMLDFSLKTAASPFIVDRSAGLKVTYDGEADAAYFYIPYGQRFKMLARDEQRTAEIYLHSIDPIGAYLLDDQGGLVSVLIPTADAVKSVDDFLFLFDYEHSDISLPRRDLPRR